MVEETPRGSQVIPEMMEPTSPPSNILIITEGQLGDLLLLTPAIRGIKSSYPAATLSLLVVERRDSGSGQTEVLAESSGHVLSSNPHLSSLYTLRRDLLRQLKGITRVAVEIRIIRFLRQEKFDTIICTFPEDRFAIWAFASGASMRIGEANRGLRWAYNRIPERKKGEGSILEYFCELAELAGSRITTFETDYFPTDEAEQWADHFLALSNLRAGHFVIVHPGATGDYKIWPPERYRAMIALLLEQTDLPVLLCGGAQDRDVVQSVARESRTPALCVHLEENISRFASLLKRAALLISNDSGPRHLAVAVRTPSLAVFRQFHDREWGVYPESDSIRVAKSGIPCALCPQGKCHDKIPQGVRYGSACLHAVSVQEVIGPALGMLSSSNL